MAWKRSSVRSRPGPPFYSPRINHFQSICSNRTKIVQPTNSGDRKYSLFTRVITRPCKHTDIYHRRCRCPKWIRGTLDDGRIIRQATNTRNWEKAELTARDLEDAANPHKPEACTRVFKLANIQKPDKTSKRCHSHMFRDTFAVESLLAGGRLIKFLCCRATAV